LITNSVAGGPKVRPGIIQAWSQDEHRGNRPFCIANTPGRSPVRESRTPGSVRGCPIMGIPTAT